MTRRITSVVLMCAGAVLLVPSVVLFGVVVVMMWPAEKLIDLAGWVKGVGR